jgi:hypothetical protein
MNSASGVGLPGTQRNMKVHSVYFNVPLSARL